MVEPLKGSVLLRIQFSLPCSAGSSSSSPSPPSSSEGQSPTSSVVGKISLRHSGCGTIRDLVEMFSKPPRGQEDASCP